jgi:hypothetical protein
VIHNNGLPARSDEPPTTYDREPTFALTAERDVLVAMRDGVSLCVDVYRPETDEPVPALLAFAIYNKDIQGPAVARDLPPQPAWSAAWAGPLEAGDTDFLVSRGYAHVVGMPRGVGKSQGGGARTWDSYDLIEWIAAQPWCDGNVGMIGISGYGAEQLHAARQRPPHLKAIAPIDPRGAYGPLGGFREEYPGGVVHLFRYLVGHFGVLHQQRGAPGELTPEREALWRAAMEDPDLRAWPHLLNVLSMKGQHMPAFFDVLLDPFVDADEAARSEAEIAAIEVPAYLGSGWYGYTYKTHLSGAQSYWRHLNAPKRLLLSGPAHHERPWHALHRELLRWYDHWLKGLDTGIMDEAPVRFWVMGAERWLEADDWPLPQTAWTKLHLTGWERLRFDPFTPSSADDRIPPDAFAQMPLTQTRTVQRLRFVTEPLPEDLLVAGPIALKLFAAIDQPDTTWIVSLKDVGPDPRVQTVREGEREVDPGLPERELSRGWLKASNRALDPERSTPWRPFHRLTREAAAPVTPGEIVEYDIEILATANLFRRGHRICLDVMSTDVPTGVAAATNAEYVPYHVTSAKTTLHTVYHDAARPSHLLLPVIPAGG